MKKLTVFIATIIVMIFATIFYIKHNSKSNGFNRKFDERPLRIEEISTLNNESFGFIYGTDEEVRFNYYHDNNTVYNLNKTLKKEDSIVLSYPPPFRTNVKRIYKYQFNDKLYAMNFYGGFAVFDKKKSIYKELKNIFADRIWVISDNSLIVRSRQLKDGIWERQLIKIDITKSPTISATYVFPEKRRNIFVSDGVLHYDKLNKDILYLYYYTGELIRLDTNLNFKYRLKTIDTVSRSNIITTIASSNKSKHIDKQTLLKPVVMVNRDVSTDQKYTYIASKLKADNENQDAFQANQIIDVYENNSGKYVNSFHLPNYKKFKLRQFDIQKNRLIASYGQYIITYRFQTHKLPF